MGFWDWIGVKQRDEIASDDEFVESLYRNILDRAPDENGRRHYLALLDSGRMTRDDLTEAIYNSEEYQAKTGVRKNKYSHHKIMSGFVSLFSAAPFLPHVEKNPFEGPQLCKLADPRLWLDEEWIAISRDLKVVTIEPERMHRKGFEWTHAIYGLSKLGALNENARCLGVGSGHEVLSYWLANHTAHVISTDLFQEKTGWAKAGGREGDPAVLRDPQKYAPFPYREGRLTFKKMDGRRLEFDDNSFDIIFSISAIEHFGGHDQAARSMREIGRTLKPGGVAVIVTELILNNRSHREFFNVDQLLEYIVAPSGLKLAQAPVFEAPEYALDNPLIMPGESRMYPHLILKIRNVVFTSVILFLRKSRDEPDETT